MNIAPPLKVGDRVVLTGCLSLHYEDGTVQKGHRGEVVCASSVRMVWIWWDGLPKTGYGVLFRDLRKLSPLEMLAECAA